jgi:hypothetical protein
MLERSDQLRLPEEEPSANDFRTQQKAKELLRTTWSKEEIEKLRKIFTHEGDTDATTLDARSQLAKES